MFFHNHYLNLIIKYYKDIVNIKKSGIIPDFYLNTYFIPFHISTNIDFIPAKNPFEKVSLKMSTPAPYPENKKNTVIIVVKRI